MRIAFIWPHGCTAYQTLPLSLGILFSSIRGRGHECRMFNLPLRGWKADSPEFLAALDQFRPDLAAVSAWPVSFKSCMAASFSVRARAPGAVVLLGGLYPTLNPVEAYSPGCFDYLLKGEAEKTFPQFVRLMAAGDRDGIARIDGIHFRDSAGRTISRPRPPFHDNLDELGSVDYDFIELDEALDRGYLATVLGPRRKVSMLASRGCRFNCLFCAAKRMNGGVLRHHSVEHMCREIRLLYARHRIRMVILQDDNVTQDREFLKDLLRGITGMGLPGLRMEFGIGARLENLDAEMLDLLKRAGAAKVTIAPESGSDRVRRSMGKDMRREDIIRAAGMVRAAGLSLQGYFIVGYPGETPAERRETYRMIRELGCDVFSLHKYQAIPGTASFGRLVKTGLVAGDHTDDGGLIGDSLPNFNGEDPKTLDRELMLAYAGFYLRRPWKVLHLLRMASKGGLTRAALGTLKAGISPSPNAAGRI